MIKSMTGYGRGEASHEGRRVVVEARSVNHRYCDINLRLSRQYASLEGKLRKLLVNRIYRGKLDLALSSDITEGASTFELNLELADSYCSALRGLKKRLSLAGEVHARDLISLPNVITFREETPDVEKDWPLIETAVNMSMDALDDMKMAEGEALALEINRGVEKITVAKDEVVKHAPLVVDSYKGRLEARVSSLEYEIDQGRLAQEIAYFADRCDISEELVRLNSHLSQFKVIAASREPAGRKLDFLIQEINREVNTIGSKGNDALISQKVVEMKAELEKIREQVQNIE